jgi:putative DNA methylase
MSAYRKKLIEVAMPLEEINAEAYREGFIYKGNPSSLHKWWAQRPLAVARTVLFAQLVDDPSERVQEFPTEEAQKAERRRLFELMAAMATWENSGDPKILNAARREILASAKCATPSVNVARDGDSLEGLSALPYVVDPFAGGGTIPLEAHRLGLRVVAGDLNPVASLINKAMLQIPETFFEAPLVGGGGTRSLRRVKGVVSSLAAAVRAYGEDARKEAFSRVAAAYPDVALPKEDGGGMAPPMAYLWARTVPSPDPAFRGAHVPLVSTFFLSTKSAKEVWVEPVVRGRDYAFVVNRGPPPNREKVGAGTKVAQGARFRCLLSGATIDPAHVRAHADAMGARLMAVVVKTKAGRRYVTATPEMERVAATPSIPSWLPDAELANNSRHMTPVIYGMDKLWKLFTRRQLAALSALADTIGALHSKICADALGAGLPDDRRGLEDSGAGARAYADAIVLYLAFALDKTIEYTNSLVTWYSKEDRPKGVFTRQALPMVWDFAELNPFGDIGGTFSKSCSIVADAIPQIHSTAESTIISMDASTAPLDEFAPYILNTDPPYYDNVPYADLSDFFYAWLRHILRPLLPRTMATIVVPKDAELVADPIRQGGADEAERFFMNGMTKALQHLVTGADSNYPAIIYYAFRQSEIERGTALSSTGWETFLEAVLAAGFALVGTWPVRSERANRQRDIGSNALASSIVLVCRKLAEDAPNATRGDFRRLLRKELPDALRKLQQGNIAPVDVAQASIGPGMAIFSRHKQVAEADGSPMSVRSALQLINEVLDEYLASGEGDFDADTRFAITWYEQHGWDAGPYGEAETLAQGRNVSVNGVVEAGIVRSGAGKVRLLKRAELPAEYDPAADARPTVWEFTQHMIRHLEDQGEEGAAGLLRRLGPRADATRELAYRLYNTCERKKWAEDARSYNGLILAWPELEKLSARITDEVPTAVPSKPSKKGKKSKTPTKGQQPLFEGDEE